MVPVGITLGQAQQATPAGAADIKVDRLIRNAEQLLGWWEFQRQLEEAAEGIDVLTQGSEAVRSAQPRLSEPLPEPLLEELSGSWRSKPQQAV